MNMHYNVNHPDYPVGVLGYDKGSEWKNIWYGEPHEISQYMKDRTSLKDSELQSMGFDMAAVDDFDDITRRNLVLGLIGYFYRCFERNKKYRLKTYYDEFIKPALDWVVEKDYGVMNILSNQENLEALVRYRLYGHKCRQSNVYYIHGREIVEYRVELQIGDMFNEKVWVDFTSVYLHDTIHE